MIPHVAAPHSCPLHTSDAADEPLRVDLGGRRIIKKKKHVRARYGPTTRTTAQRAYITNTHADTHRHDDSSEHYHNSSNARNIIKNMNRRHPSNTQSNTSAASDVYKNQDVGVVVVVVGNLQGQRRSDLRGGSRSPRAYVLQGVRAPPPCLLYPPPSPRDRQKHRMPPPA